MTTEHQRELVAYGYTVLGLVLPAVIFCFIVRLRPRVLRARAAVREQSSAAPISATAAILRSLRWGFFATLVAAVLCLVPGINLLAYGLLTLAGSAAFALGIPGRFIEPSSCLLLLLAFMFFFTAFRLTHLLFVHDLAPQIPNDRNA